MAIEQELRDAVLARDKTRVTAWVKLHEKTMIDPGQLGCALADAATAGHAGIVEEISAHPLARVISGHTLGSALTAAARGGHLAIVKKILAHQNAGGAGGIGFGLDQALRGAAEGGYRDIVEIILAKYAGQLNAKQLGEALWGAARGGHEALLWECINPTGNRPVTYLGHFFEDLPMEERLGYGLWGAGGDRHVAIVTRILAHGNAGQITADYLGGALVHAARGGHLASVEKIIVHPNAAQIHTDHLNDALRGAAEGGHERCTFLLRQEQMKWELNGLQVPEDHPLRRILEKVKTRGLDEGLYNMTLPRKGGDEMGVVTRDDISAILAYSKAENKPKPVQGNPHWLRRFIRALFPRIDPVQVFVRTYDGLWQYAMEKTDHAQQVMKDMSILTPLPGEALLQILSHVGHGEIQDPTPLKPGEQGPVDLRFCQRILAGRATPPAQQRW